MRAHVENSDPLSMKSLLVRILEVSFQKIDVWSDALRVFLFLLQVSN